MASNYEKEDELSSDEEYELKTDEEIIGFSIEEYNKKYFKSNEEIDPGEKKKPDLWKLTRLLSFVESVPEGFVFPPADTPIPIVIEMVNDMIKQKARERLEYVETNGKWNLFLNADGKPYVPENLVRKCAHYPPDMSQFEVGKPTFPLQNTCQGQQGVTNSSDSTGDQRADESSIDSSGEIECINMEGCKAEELCITENNSAELRHDISENFETSLMIISHSESETRCKKVNESQLLGHEISTNKTEDINSSTLQDSVAHVKVSTHDSIVDEISDQNRFVDNNISDEDMNRTMIVCDLVSQDLSISASLEENTANEIKGNVESPEVNNVSFVIPEVEYMDIHDIITSSHMIVCDDSIAEKAETKVNKSEEAKETYVSEVTEKYEPVEGKQKGELEQTTEKYDSENVSGGIIVSDEIEGVEKMYKSEEAKESYVSEAIEKYEPVGGKQKGEMEQTTEKYESKNVSGGIIASDEIKGVKKMYKSEEAKETYVSEAIEKYEPIEGKQKAELEQTTEKYESENVSGGIIISDEIEVVKKMYKSEEAKETYVSEVIEKSEPVEGKQKGELKQTTEKYESENVSGGIIVSDEIEGVKKMYKSEKAKETYVSEAIEKHEPIEGKQKAELEQTTEKYESENVSGGIIVSDEIKGVKKMYKSEEAKETYVSEAIEKYEPIEGKQKAELEQTTEKYESENVSGGIIISGEIEVVKKMYKSEEAKETYVSEVIEKSEPVEGKQKGELKQTTEKYESENVSGGIIVSDEIEGVKKKFKSETYVSEAIEKYESEEVEQKVELEQTIEKYESENVSGAIIVSDEIEGVKKMYKSEEAKETYVSEVTEKYEPVEGKQKGELEQTTEKYDSENVSGGIIVSDEIEGVEKMYKSEEAKESYVSEAIEKYEPVGGKQKGEMEQTTEKYESKNVSGGIIASDEIEGVKKMYKSEKAKETYVSEAIEKYEPIEGKQKAALEQTTEKYESENVSGGIIVSDEIKGVKKMYKSEEAKETYVSEAIEKYEPIEGKQKAELEQTTEKYESENVSGGIIISDEIEVVKKMYKSEEAKETYVSEVIEKSEPVEGKQKGELKQTTEKYESENVSGGIIVSDETEGVKKKFKSETYVSEAIEKYESEEVEQKVELEQTIEKYESENVSGAIIVSDEIEGVKKMYKSEEAKETYVSEVTEKYEPVEGKQKGELEQTTEKYDSENVSGAIIVSDEIEGVKEMYKSEEAKETYVSEAIEKFEPVEGKQKGELEQTTEKYESENISGCIIVSDELEGVKKKYKSETYVSEAIEKYESEEVKGKSSGVRETMLSDEAKNLEKRKRVTKDSVTSSVTTSTISITSEAIPDTEDKEVCLSNITGDLSDDEVCNKKFKKAEKEEGKILEITDDDDSSNTVLVEETSEEGRSVKQTDTSIHGDVNVLSEESVDTAKKIETGKESDEVMKMVDEQSTEMNGNIAAKGYGHNAGGVYSKDRFEVEGNLKDGDEMRVVAIDESSKMLENAYKTDDINDTIKKVNTEAVEGEDDSDDRMPLTIVIQEKHESDDEVQAIMETNRLSTKGMHAAEKNVDEGPVKRDYEEDMPDAGSPASNINPSNSDETLQSSGHALGEQDLEASGEALKRSRQESPSDLYPKKRLMTAVPVEDTHEDSQDSVVQVLPEQMQEPLILSPTNTDTDGSSTVESRHHTEAQATISEKTESPEESEAPAM